MLAVLLLNIAVANSQNFSTQDNGIRNVVKASIQKEEMLFVSEIDQKISCYTLKGEKKWEVNTDSKAIIFEIVAGDVNGDGDDDLIVASGDGNIYCWDSKGGLLWKFNPGVKVRFSEVALVNNDGNVQVFAGGNNYKLYELNAKGKLMSETTIKGVVRKLESGRFLDSKKESLFVFTLKHDKHYSNFFGFIDPNTKKNLNSKPLVKILDKILKKTIMVHTTNVVDVNKDGKDEIVLFGSAGGASFVAIDGDLNVVSSFEGTSKDNQRYAYTYGACLLPVTDKMVLQKGGIIYVTDLEGKLLNKSGKRYKEIIYNNLTLLPKSKTVVGGGQVGGGNGLYFYDLTKKKWWDKEHRFIGRYKEVENNINSLYKKALEFKAPEYQKKSDKSYNMITGIPETKEVKKIKYQDVNYIRQYIYSENTDRSALVKKIGKVALKKDKRKKYNLTREQVLEKVREHEKNNNPFTLWVGHGSDPFMLQIETLEEIVRIAPNTCYGFIYAEMSHVDDPRIIHFVKEYVPRLAKVIRENKSHAKLYFRYKSMFWAADSHGKLWQELFFSNKYNDILIPAAEDTNNRLQDLNFAGRVGMFASGAVNDYAMRLVDDNPTSWRPLSPGGQRSVSPYLRNGVIMAAYGARYGILFNISYLEKPSMNVLFALMKSGVLPVVDKEDILSIGSWHLIKNMNEEYLKEVNEGHNLNVYSIDADKSVVSVPSVAWCGASIPEHDFSKIAMGGDYRWLNFIPEIPNGMVPIANVNYLDNLKSAKKDYVISDVKDGYIDGKKVRGIDFGAHMQKTVNTGASKLLLKVKGASWSLIRLDDKHARLILVDPGYVDPQNRQVKVSLQGVNIPVNAIDILTKEKISIKDKSMDLIVPAGSMRFIDLEFNKKINKNK